MVDEFPQAQVLGEGGRKEQSGIGHQAVVVKDDADAVGIVRWQHLLGAPCFPGGFLFQNHYPRFRGAPSAFFKGCPQGRPSVDSGLTKCCTSFVSLGNPSPARCAVTTPGAVCHAARSNQVVNLGGPTSV